MTEKITINIVDIGFNINEEIQKTLKAEISKETLSGIDDIMTAISSKPENKKSVAKVEVEKKLEEIVQFILINGKITKDELSKMIPDKNIISIIGLLRNFASKFHNKELIKQKDYYIFVS
jgi:hypothetical protein